MRAYELLDGAPVMSRGDGFVVDDRRVDPRSLAAWIGTRRYVTDPRQLKALRIWASCTARREPVKTRFQGLGWHPKTADRQRRAALAAIAAGLNAERKTAAQDRLDNVL